MILRPEDFLVRGGLYNRWLGELWFLMIFIEWIAALIKRPTFT